MEEEYLIKQAEKREVREAVQTLLLADRLGMLTDAYREKIRQIVEK